VARGTQHRKRRPRPDARPASAVAAPRKSKKQKPPQWQEQLFFSRLRVHAKWMFVLLAVVFAVSFVFFGVGSGSTGISSALSNFFNFGGSSGPSVSNLEKKVAKNPKNAADWRALATAYETKHDTQGAITALQHYTQLKPKDQSGLQELATEYTSLADTYNTQAQSAEIAQETANLSPTFLPASNTSLGKAFTSTTGPLSDPISNANANTANQTTQTAVQQLTSIESQAEDTFKQLAALSPSDASVQIQLGQAAEAANDTASAIAAYKKFLKLAPTDPLAPQVKSVLKQLEPAKK
jgi:tetratricopeptide (TPR) repeat protein